MKWTLDKHLYKVVVFAAIFAVLFYFQRKTGTSNIIQNLNHQTLQKSRLSSDSYLKAYRPQNELVFKTRNIKWYVEKTRIPGTNLFGNESRVGSGNSDDAEVRRGFPRLNDRLWQHERLGRCLFHHKCQWIKNAYIALRNFRIMNAFGVPPYPILRFDNVSKAAGIIFRVIYFRANLFRPWISVKLKQACFLIVVMRFK